MCVCFGPCSISFCLHQGGFTRNRGTGDRVLLPRSNHEGLLERFPPPPLPAKRERSLSISAEQRDDHARGALGWIGGCRRKTLSQRSSPLFAKLPPELRTLILNEVVGTQVHIIRIPGRFVHVPCDSSNQGPICVAKKDMLSDWRSQRYLFTRYGYGDMDKYKFSIANGLFRTCRRMSVILCFYANNIHFSVELFSNKLHISYSEAVTCFYTHPIFHLQRLGSPAFISTDASS